MVCMVRHPKTLSVRGRTAARAGVVYLRPAAYNTRGPKFHIALMRPKRQPALA
jgi:hypothetical protein